MPRARAGKLTPWAKNLWRHVSRIEPYKKGVLWVIIVMPLLAMLLYDGMQFGISTPGFWLASAVSFALYLTTYMLLMLPFAVIPALSRSGMGKLLVYLSAVTIKTATFAFIFFDRSDTAIELLLERTPGDLTIGVIIWAAIATVSTSNTDYRQSLAELNRVTEELEIHRDKRASAADLAEKGLKRLAVTSLQSELEKISHGLRSIGQERDIWRLSAEIRQLVEQKVRPLSRNLRSRIDLMADVTFPPRVAIKKSAFVTLRVSPKLDSRFWFSYWVASINIFVTIGQLSNWYIALTVQAISLSYPLIGSILSGLWNQRIRIGLWGSIAWSASASLIAYLPTLWILNYWAQQELTLVRIQFTAYLVIVLSLVAFTSWASHQRVRDEQLTSIQQFNTDIKRELALMDQAVWLAQRKWSYLIHGTVQGALTVAGSRLVFSDNPGPKVISQVIRDVEKAKRALQEAVEFRMGTALLAAEISTSWDGLCEVRFEIPEPVQERLDMDESGRTCFMEISKELVSNAYRHGRASKVWISSYLKTEHDVQIIVSNDGALAPGDAQPGLGFAMFDELTSQWEIEAVEPGRFTATIPLGS